VQAPKSRTFPQLDQAARKAGPIIRMIIVSMTLPKIWADRKSVMDAVITGFCGGKEGAKPKPTAGLVSLTGLYLTI
jgi:hypothetical protein